MRAAFIEQTGPVENIKVGDLPKPEPKPGQVLVRVKAVALNPIDLYVRAGLVPMPCRSPTCLDPTSPVWSRPGPLGRARLSRSGTAFGARTKVYSVGPA